MDNKAICPEKFLNPPRDFSVLPFRSCEDDLRGADLLRQIADLEARGVYSADGRNFTSREMLWAANWCFVHGVSMTIPLAFYYSMRANRTGGIPPEAGPDSAWWDDYEGFYLYCRRMSWLNTDSRHVCNIAVLGEADSPPWRAAKACFENQRDFNYIEAYELNETASVSAEGITLAGMHYEALILDGDYALDAGAQSVLEVLRQAGRIVVYNDNSSLIEQLDTVAARDLGFATPQPNLRYRHVQKAGLDYYLLFNEGETVVDSDFTVGAKGSMTWIHPWPAEVAPAESRLTLQPQQMRLLVVQP